MNATDKYKHTSLPQHGIYFGNKKFYDTEAIFLVMCDPSMNEL
jgi:hypothetical protein